MRVFFILTLILTSILAQGLQARPVGNKNQPQITDDSAPWVRFPASLSKSAVDTMFLLGGPDRWDGTFDSPDGGPDWHGWTHVDLTASGINHWHVSTYWAEYFAGNGPDNHAMYCGQEDLPACAPEDTVGGLGDNYFDDLEWRYTVADPLLPTTIHLTGKLNYDLTDAGWDFLELFIQRGSEAEMLATWTGTGDTTVTLDFTETWAPGELAGLDSNMVRVWWRVWSDSGWSDEDCLSPGHGACQLDDLAVSINGLLITYDDFEPGNTINWNQAEFSGVGDFTNLRNDLGDDVPCLGNTTYQVNFVDDGVAVPLTGGTPCISFCYDPGGWIVNNTGGLLAGDSRDWFTENMVLSPPLAWIPGTDAAELSFDVYVDEKLQADSPGVFYLWHVRSTASEDPADLELAPWKSRNFVFYGFPEYRRHNEPVSDLLVEDRKWVQISLEVNEMGWNWGWNGHNGTPAPYFDNVAFRAWAPEGPEILVKSEWLFSDSFPETETLDPLNLATNSCRVDGSVNNYNSSVIGDSLVAQITPVRWGAELVEPPALNWVLQCNPLFDPVRPAAPNAQGILRGMNPGTEAIGPNGYPGYNQWAFDLPDTGWFYPGDVLHYYITATNDLDGDTRTAVWPPDTTGVLDFTPGSLYSPEAIVHALPTLSQTAAGALEQPPVLFVDNTGNQSATDAWLAAMADIGKTQAVDYDAVTISRGRIGLDGLASVGNLAGYQTILYSSGDRIGNAIFFDETYLNDSTLFNAWLDTGGKRALFSGDGLMTDMTNSTPGLYLLDKLGVDLYYTDISEGNGGFLDLEVYPLPSNGVLPEHLSFLVDGSCPDIKSIDGIVPIGSGLSAASLAPAGSGGDIFSAVVTNHNVPLGNKAVALPFDLDQVSGAAERATFLDYLLIWLNSDTSAAEDTPTINKVSASAHPNPFNPSTTIGFALPKAVDVSLNIFDIQGRLIRTLLDESPYTRGQHTKVWDGRDSDGQNTASGVYFFRLQAGDQQRVGKLTLVK